MKLKRISIDAKDVQQLTGRSVYYARKILRAIRKKTGKTRNQLVTIYDLCDHLNLPLQETIDQLSLSRSASPNANTR
jgi:hypothetical protein